MNRKVLKLELDLDFQLIAITTSLKDYRTCYLINKHLNFDFTRQQDLKVDIHPASQAGLFSLYHYQQDESDADFYFIANKGSEGSLIPEMREADYFMMIKNYIDEDDLEQIVTGLNRIPEIVAAVKIDPKRIKSRENLLF